MVRSTRKHIKAYFLIGGGIVMLFLLTVAMFDPTSITFKSSAVENLNSVNINENAIVAIDIPSEELPSCVKRISYIPEADQTSCLASIKCADAIEHINDGCEVSQSVLSCYDPSSCIALNVWVDRAKEMCGC